MTTDTTYNGWTNYATWRVNLEIFDGLTSDYYGTNDTTRLAQELRDHAEEIIEATTTEAGLARDYAMAFLGDVNWREIARHLIEANEEIDA
jgi:hypothetical protein